MQAADLTEQLRESARQAALRAAETERVVKTVSLALGRLGNRLGEWVEATVEPAAVRLFSRFSGGKVMGALACLSVREDVAQYAQEQGFFLIVPNENVTIANDVAFQARAW